MSDPVEVTVTAPDVWASQSEQLAQLLRACVEGNGPSVIPDPSGRPPDPRRLTVIVSPALWAAEPQMLHEALSMAAADGDAPATPTSLRSAAGVAPVEQRLVFTVEEAASLLGISRSFAYEAIQRGEIPSMRIGKRILVPKAALERHLLISGSAATPANASPRSIGMPEPDEQNEG
ncbi:MAG: helix-turn-helix domain-containing protein [Acidimicrobiales bacterium]